MMDTVQEVITRDFYTCKKKISMELLAGLSCLLSRRWGPHQLEGIHTLFLSSLHHIQVSLPNLLSKKKVSLLNLAGVPPAVGGKTRVFFLKLVSICGPHLEEGYARSRVYFLQV